MEKGLWTGKEVKVTHRFVNRESSCQSTHEADDVEVTKRVAVVLIKGYMNRLQHIVAFRENGLKGHYGVVV